MLKIGLFGYGKMGRAIESLAPEHGVEIAWRITQVNRTEVTPELLRQADVVIEFTRPEAAFENVMLCLEASIPVVSGTTGWLEKLPEAQDFCQKNGGALLWASNFSVGVNLFFALNSYLSKLMNERVEYVPSVTEIHHIHKLDAPSGTAITLAEGLIKHLAAKTEWANQSEVAENQISIVSLREGEVPGTHIIHYNSEVDSIEIKHTAHNRQGFALGAVVAAEWLAPRQGVFGMDDLLGEE